MNTDFKFDGQLHPSPHAPELFTAGLPGGLKVLIKVDRRSPVAVCNVWVKVGSNREPEKLRGWSHGIEHMLFKGTPRRDEGDFAREVAESGGSTNAGTGYETTNYHITVPAGNLPRAVDILGDALLGSVFEPDSLDAERQVLVHENHMYDDIPFGFGITWRWALDLAFDQSPYRHPIGGRDSNLLERDREEILAFYRSAYSLDNMTVVIVGDVDPRQTLSLVAEKFLPGSDPGPVAADPEVTLVKAPPTEPAHPACRLLVRHGDIKRAYCKLVLPGPAEGDPQRPALSVLRRVLSDGRSCRLFRRLQEKLKLVDDFAFMTETGPREGVIILDMETDPQRLPAAIRAAGEILDEVAREGCTDAELERAQVRVARSFLFGEETVQGQASTLGYHEVMDDLAGAFDFPDRVARVRKGDVASLSRRLFKLNDLSCVIYLPEGVDPAATGIPTDAEGLQELMAGLLEHQEAVIPAAESQAAPTLPSWSRGPSAGDSLFEKLELPGGISLHCRVDRSLPVMGMTLTIKGGATAETATNAGLSTLTQMVQIKGAGNLDSETLHSLLEGEGASLSPRAERDFCGLSFGGLDGRLERSLELMGMVAVAPDFPPDEMEQERRLALEQLASLEDNPFQAAAVEMRRLMYGDHPYGRPLQGTLASLPNLTREHLLAQHHQAWTAANLQIVASGSFDPEWLARRLETVLADLPQGFRRPDPAPGDARTPDQVVVSRLDKDQNQSVVLVGWPGVSDSNRDRAEMMLFKEILNGQAGRLFERLRNRKSLCYNTGTLSTAGFGQGMFLGYVLTSPETETQARTALVEELEKLTVELVTGDEFARSRAKLVGNLLIGSQSNSAKVMRASQDLMFGRDPNGLPALVSRLQACQPEDIRRLARDIILPEHRYEVTMGPS